MLMATLDQDTSCQSRFENWIIQQRQDLEELIEVLNSSNPENEMLKSLVSKSIEHFQDYTERRALMALEDVPSLYCPPWCTPFEKCHFWLGGCRPSLSIRLLCSLSEAEFEAQLSEFLEGKRRGNLGEITVDQLITINNLRCQVVRDEEQLYKRMENLHEGIADDPYANTVAKASISIDTSQQELLNQATNARLAALAEILSEADKLRLETLKELLLNILTPLQAVELLVGSKRLHLYMHQLGQTMTTSRNHT